MKGALVALVLIAAVLPLADRFTDPFLTHADANTAAFAQPARNYLRFGLAATRLGMATDLGDERPPRFGYNAHHPPGYALAAAAVFLVTGVHDWAARIWPALCSVGSLLLVFLIWRRPRGDAVGALAAVMAATLPAYGHFGKMLGEEAPTLFFGLLAIHLYLRWSDETAPGPPRSLIPCLAAYAAGCLSGWAAFHVGPILMLDAALSLRGAARRRALIGIGVTGVIVFAAIAGQFFLLRGSLEDILDAAAGRTLARGSAAAELVGRGPWLDQEAGHFLRIYGIEVAFAALAGLAAAVVAIARRRARLQVIRTILIVAAFGVAHPVVFRWAAYHHNWLLFHLIPVLGIAAAEGTVLVAGAVRLAARSLRAPPRAAAAAMIAAAALPLGHRAWAAKEGLDRLATIDRRVVWPMLGFAIRDRVPAGTRVMANFRILDSIPRFYADRACRPVMNDEDWAAATASATFSLYVRDRNIPLAGSIEERLRALPWEDIGPFRFYDLAPPPEGTARGIARRADPTAAPMAGGPVDASFGGAVTLTAWSVTPAATAAGVEGLGRLLLATSRWKFLGTDAPPWSVQAAIARRGEDGRWVGLPQVALLDQMHPRLSRWAGLREFEVEALFLVPPDLESGNWEVRFALTNEGAPVRPVQPGPPRPDQKVVVAGTIHVDPPPAAGAVPDG